MPSQPCEPSPRSGTNQILSPRSGTTQILGQLAGVDRAIRDMTRGYEARICQLAAQCQKLQAKLDLANEHLKQANDKLSRGCPNCVASPVIKQADQTANIPSKTRQRISGNVHATSTPLLKPSERPAAIISSTPITSHEKSGAHCDCDETVLTSSLVIVNGQDVSRNHTDLEVEIPEDPEVLDNVEDENFFSPKVSSKIRRSSPEASEMVSSRVQTDEHTRKDSKSPSGSQFTKFESLSEVTRKQVVKKEPFKCQYINIDTELYGTSVKSDISVGKPKIAKSFQSASQLLDALACEDLEPESCQEVSPVIGKSKFKTPTKANIPVRKLREEVKNNSPLSSSKRRRPNSAQKNSRSIILVDETPSPKAKRQLTIETAFGNSPGKQAKRVKKELETPEKNRIPAVVPETCEPVSPVASRVQSQSDYRSYTEDDKSQDSVELDSMFAPSPQKREISSPGGQKSPGKFLDFRFDSLSPSREKARSKLIDPKKIDSKDDTNHNSQKPKSSRKITDKGPSSNMKGSKSTSENSNGPFHVKSSKTASDVSKVTAKKASTLMSRKDLNESFDLPPAKRVEIDYKYEAVVRGNAAREKLKGNSCFECEQYYKSLDPSAASSRLKQCSRHRTLCTPPKTPSHFWSLELPPTPDESPPKPAPAVARAKRRKPLGATAK